MKIIVIILFLFNSIYGFSCSCFEPETLEKDFEISKYVFEGTVIAHELVWVKDTIHPFMVKRGFLTGNPDVRDSVTIFRYTMEIEKTYKGKISHKKVIIYSEMPCLQCGFPFSIGQKYIVFASLNGYVEWNTTNEVKKKTESIYLRLRCYFGIQFSD